MSDSFADRELLNQWYDSNRNLLRYVYLNAMLEGNPFNTVFSRFSLTETNSLGILPNDISDVEAMDMKLKVEAKNAKNKAARGPTKSKSKKRPKTKPYTSLALTKS